VTIGHGALVHACTIGDGCLVGMGATVLDGAVLEPGSVVAAGAVVTPGGFAGLDRVWVWGLDWGGFGLGWVWAFKELRLAELCLRLRLRLQPWIRRNRETPHPGPSYHQAPPTPPSTPTNRPPTEPRAPPKPAATGAVVKTGQIYAGAPAKLLRTLTAEEASFLKQSADNYTALAAEHRCGGVGGGWLGCCVVGWLRRCLVLLVGWRGWLVLLAGLLAG